MSLSQGTAFKKIQDIWGTTPPSSVAHVMVDVQRGFCDPAHAPQNASIDMDAVASRIADLQSSFHRAGARSVIVYFDDLREGYDQAMGGPHKISTDHVDIIMSKRYQSAFEETKLADELRARGISHLLLSGFYADMCVTRTGIGALNAGFHTAVMLDLTRAVKHFRPIHDLTSIFQFHGMIPTSSDDALSWIQGARSPLAF